MTDDALVQAAARAYIYGYPLLYNLDEIQKLPDGRATIAGGDAVPWNTFGLARDLLGPETEFVSPNNDTLYLIAPARPVGRSGAGRRPRHPRPLLRAPVRRRLDQQLRLHRPTGHRAPRRGASPSCRPGFAGSVDDGSTVIHAPTEVMVIVGRLQVDGEADLPAVHALQDQFTLTACRCVGAARRDPRRAADGVADDLVWWDRLRVALAAFPPPAGDAPFIARLERLGSAGGRVAVHRPGPRSWPRCCGLVPSRARP